MHEDQQVFCVKRHMKGCSHSSFKLKWRGSSLESHSQQQRRSKIIASHNFDKFPMKIITFFQVLASGRSDLSLKLVFFYD